MDGSVVTLKGQVVIPKKIRSMFHSKKGTQIRFEGKNGEIVLKPLTQEYFEKMAGILGAGGKATKALLEERAQDRERENR